MRMRIMCGAVDHYVIWCALIWDTKQQNGCDIESGFFALSGPETMERPFFVDH